MSPAGPSVRLDHVHLRSRDPDAAARFYVERLGGVVAERIDMPEMLRLVVDLGGARLLIDRVPEGTPTAPATPHLGLEHLGLAVDDIEALAADLAAKGVVFTVAPKVLRPGLKIAFMLGPDGVLIELLERSPT